MVDEMLEDLSEILKQNQFYCKTVNEWIEGSPEKLRKIHDPEIRGFLIKRKEAGEDITLITADRELAGHVDIDGLSVINVQKLVLAKVRELESYHAALDSGKTNITGRPPSRRSD
jgi:hypothetical protein